MGIKISNIASSGGFKLSGNNVGRFIITALSGGGGTDVTPNPTPNWAAIINDSSSPPIVAVQQIQGIDSIIDLEVSKSGGSFKIYYKIDNSAPAWTNGGALSAEFTSWTEIISFPVVINVSNNQYVSFGCAPAFIGQNATSTITVKNNSDSAITLNTFTAIVSNEE